MRAVAVGAVALPLLLSSCVAGSPYPAFDRAATDEDQLPEVFYQSEFDGYTTAALRPGSRAAWTDATTT